MVLSGPGEQRKPVRSGILDDIENFVTAGYGKKEDLRALDKTLREKYHSELMRLRHQWEKINLGVLNAGQSAIGRDCKSAMQTIDRLAALVNRADYGYAGLFDRVEKIQEKALTSVLEHDRGLAVHLVKLDQDMVDAKAALKSGDWSTLETIVETLNEDLSAFEENWDKRKQVMSS
jgi:hypothetical protein